MIEVNLTEVRDSLGDILPRSYDDSLSQGPVSTVVEKEVSGR